MAIRSRTTTTESTGSTSTDVMRKHRPFTGLFLAPLVGLLASWVLHAWTMGVHWGPIDTPGSPGVTALLGTSLGAISVVLAFTAWHFAKHRDDAVRWAFTISTGLISLLFAANVWRGPSYWLSGAFLVLSFMVATVWSLARTNVARNDKRNDSGEQHEREGFLDKLGVSKLTKWKTRVEHDEKGRPARLVIDAEHADGQTSAIMTDNLDAIASQVASETGLPVPHDLHSAVPGARADQSTTTVHLRNPFEGHRPLGPLTNPGKSIAEWTSFADYADNGQPFFMTIAYGLHLPGSCSYCIAGMTRAGKTVAENQMLTDWLSRIDFVLLYLNQAKGMQDVRPLLPAVEAVVISEDNESGHGDYIAAAQSVKKIMGYRQNVLAQFNVGPWSPRCGHPDEALRPSIPDPSSPIGKRIVMERMPFLVAHFAEADSILEARKMDALAIHIASKGLSLGVATGWSLQRPSWKSMNTDLRGNLGMRLCFGVADDDAAEFMLDAEERQRGAKPEKWGQKKPGQFYATGPGIDEDRVPVALKTRFLVGDELHPDGRKKTFDELNDAYTAELLRRNYENAKTVCKLDRGSAEATGGWWDAQVAKTNDLRDRMLHGKVSDDSAPRTPHPAVPHSAPAESAPAPRTGPRSMADADPAPKPRPLPQADPADDDAVSAEEIEEGVDEFMEDVRSASSAEPTGDPDFDEMRDELYPADDEDSEELRTTSVHPPENVPTEDFDPLADSVEDDKPAARTRQEAIEVLAGALNALIDEKGDGSSVVTGPDEISDRHGLRSRPWVSGEVTKLLMGEGDLAGRFVAELHGKAKLGRYRIQRIGQTDHP